MADAWLHPSHLTVENATRKKRPSRTWKMEQTESKTETTKERERERKKERERKAIFVCFSATIPATRTLPATFQNGEKIFHRSQCNRDDSIHLPHQNHLIHLHFMNLSWNFRIFYVYYWISNIVLIKYWANISFSTGF